MERIFPHQADVGDLHLEAQQVDQKWRWAVLDGEGRCIASGTVETLQAAQTAAEQASGGERAEWRTIGVSLP